jgi:uncharacterized protein YcbK (DUF882 family)
MDRSRWELTAHFSVAEFDCHDGTPYPPDWVAPRLKRLCFLLETIRYTWDAPMEILSGYRTPTWNTRVGGALASQHLAGRAADIRVAGKNAVEVHEEVLRLWTLEQLPDLGGLGLYATFVHVDIRPHAGTALAQWTGRGVG